MDMEIDTDLIESLNTRFCPNVTENIDYYEIKNGYDNTTDRKGFLIEF